jgi:hypothetical protein
MLLNISLHCTRELGRVVLKYILKSVDLLIMDISAPPGIKKKVCAIQLQYYCTVTLQASMVLL